MATQFVPVGGKVMLKAQVRGSGASSVTSVDFKLYRLSSVLKSKKAVETVTGQVSGGEVSVEWEAKGLDAKEMSCTVLYDVEAGKTKVQGADEIVVFRDSLKVTAKDADDTASALPLALCSLKIEPDIRFPMPSDHPWKAQRTKTLRTDETGVALFDTLPPAKLELSWRSPYSLKKWNEKEGPEREAVVKRGVQAQFVFPPSGSRPHRQLVNLAADPRKPERGCALKVKVKVNAAVSGSGRIGDRIWLKATFDAENSDRNADPAPEFEGKPGTKGKEYVVEKQLDSDGGTVEFELNVGAAGGDKVLLAVGGTKDCADQEIEVENWRKLIFVPVKPAAAYPLPNGQFPQGIRESTAKALKQAFIEAVFEPAITVEAEDQSRVPEWYGYDIVVVSEDVAEKYGLPRQKLYFHKTDGTPHPNFRKKFMAAGGPPDQEPRMYVLIGGAIYANGNGCRKTIELKKAESDWIDFTETLLPIDPTGTSPLGKYNYSEWTDTQSHKGGVTDAFLEIKHKEKQLKIKLPSASSTDPGRLVSEQNPVTLKLTLENYSFAAGGALPGIDDWITAVWRDDAKPLAAAYTILHELGHVMEQACYSVAKMPGMKLDHPFHYGDNSPKDTSQHGHKGPHCSFGLSDTDRKKESYSELVAAGKHGHCVMFGGIGEKTDFALALQICETCEPYFRAWKL